MHGFERSGDHAQILFSLKHGIPTDKAFFSCMQKISEPKFHHIMSFSRKHLTKSQVNSDYFMMAIELKCSAICIGNHTSFLVQFGSNLRKAVTFKKYQNNYCLSP